MQHGEQNRELRRPDAWWYVGYNLYFMTEVASIADRLGIKMWTLNKGKMIDAVKNLYANLPQ